jgi:FdhD protein
MENNPGLHAVTIFKQTDNQLSAVDDVVAVEEPLAISILRDGDVQPESLSVTMRTPGTDSELAVGFLFTEGIITSASDVESVSTVRENEVVVHLKQGVKPDIASADRNFYMTSSCGVCGKSSIDAITTCSIYPIQAGPLVRPETLFQLQKTISRKQSLFSATGGIHAAATFINGECTRLSEDVGRHNALDKLIGSALLSNDLPLSNCILLLSGRASFELLQKATMAGIPIIASVGAPSSLAVNLAKDQGQTLIGFLKNNQFNIYTGHERVEITS